MRKCGKPGTAGRNMAGPGSSGGLRGGSPEAIGPSRPAPCETSRFGKRGQRGRIANRRLVVNLTAMWALLPLSSLTFGEKAMDVGGVGCHDAGFPWPSPWLRHSWVSMGWNGLLRAAESPASGGPAGPGPWAKPTMTQGRLG